MSHGTRFVYKQVNAPGPGSYEQLGEVKNPTHICSNYHSPKVKNLGTTAAKPFQEKDVTNSPGPGTYRQPSDFGYVDLIKPRKIELGFLQPRNFTQ